MGRIYKSLNSNNRKKQAVWGFLAACLLFVFVYRSRLILPVGIEWKEKTLVIPDNPAMVEGEIVLKDKSLQYIRGDEILYTMNEKFKVADAEITDIDRDGMVEVSMLVWTRGDYGDAHPTFEQPSKYRYTSRFYLFEIEEDRLVPKWMSSKLPFEAYAMTVEDGMLILRSRHGFEDSYCWKSWGMEGCD